MKWNGMGNDLAFIDPVTLDTSASIGGRFLPGHVSKVLAHFADDGFAGCRGRVVRCLGLDGVDAFQRSAHAVLVGGHDTEEVLLAFR